MDRRVIWLCVGFGSIAGSLVPEAWGGSAMDGISLLFGVLGGLGGLWLGVRLTS
jgi:hypothetical protein